MSWVQLDPAHRVRIIRPTEVEIGTHLVKNGRVVVDYEAMCRFCVDWDGFTEADLLGASVGGTDAAPYTPALWAEICSDHIEWVTTVSSAILEAAANHQTAKDAALKN